MAKRRAHRPQGSRPIGLLESDRPAPSGAASLPAKGLPAADPPAATLRPRFEAASRPWLVRMAALPAPVVPVMLAAMLFAGLAIPAAWAGLLLIAIALFLSWLTAVSWPAVSPASRALRVVVNGGVLAVGILKLLGLV